MNRIIVGVMMLFMAIGALDKALLNNRLGYGQEFERGIQAMGPLTLMMAGIMCAAPALGSFLTPALAPLFRCMDADPGAAGGMLFGIDMGGFPLVQRMTDDPEVWLLSGVLLASTLGVSITFTIPVGLGMCSREKQPFAAKGIVAGIIASPIAALAGGAVCGISLDKIISTTLPAFLLAAVLVFCLTVFQKRTLQFFLLFSKILTALGTLGLAAGILEELLGLAFIPGLAPLEEQLVLIGEIAITLAGAYPMVKAVQDLLTPMLSLIAKAIRTDETAVCGMLTGLANPLLMYDQTGSMTSRGIVLAFAFNTPTAALLGDHLGYISAVYPDGTSAMLIGKVAAGALALGIALILESNLKIRRQPTSE